MPEISYRAPPTLARMLRSNAFVRAVVGPVGSGKSSGCVVEVLRRAVEQAPGQDRVRRTRFAVIRNTYRELKDTTRKTFEQWVPPALGKWHEQDFTFTIDKPLKDGTRVHSEVLFRALDRPEDVRKLLSLELTGAYINEARQVPKAILDVLTTRVGRYPSKAQGGPTWYGIWMDTNPWHTGHWGYKLFTKERPGGYDLYEQPGGREPAAENLENLPPGYYDRQMAGKDTAWIAEYIDSQYPSHDHGSVYGSLISAIEARGAVLDFPLEMWRPDGTPEINSRSVFTTWDLGRSDSTAIWIWRLRPGGVDVVDHYENRGQKLRHYFDVLEERQRTMGYRYVKHWLPHDAAQETLATEVSTLNQFISRFGAAAVAIGPQLSVDSGIAAARWLLEQDIRFHARCDTSPAQGVNSGLEALRSYRYEWDEVLLTFKKTPLHDWASHSADAFRYVACVVKRTAANMQLRDPSPSPKPINTRAPTMDELWENA